jgi:ABC-type multidrug transport system fused ATPase/permease subunit
MSCTDLKNKYDSVLKQQELLQRQLNAQDKINSLLETSTQSIMCGPDCQKDKTSNELKQQYLDAKTNNIIAPIKLEESRKNYYVYTKGENYYNNMLDEELKNRAEKLSELISDSFNEEVANAKTMNQYYNTSLINSSYTKELLEEYSEKNSELKLKLRDNHGDILTNDRKTYYESTALDRLKLWYTFYWYIYYIFVIIFLLAIFLSPSKLSIIVKLIILILLVFYPYYIDYVSNMIFTNIKNVYNSLPKSVYNNL